MGSETTIQDIGRPPRVVQTTKLGHILRVGLVALAVFVPILFIYLAGAKRHKLDQLQAEGRQVVGRVMGKTSSKTSNSLSYQFTIDGQVYRGNEDVSRDRYDDARVDSEVTITYLPADPKVNVPWAVRPGDAESANDKTLLLGALCTLGAIVGVIAIERHIRLDRRLCESGVSVVGAVTGQIVGKNSRIQYAFPLPDGQQQYGIAQATHATRRMNAGDALVILYDADKPAVNKPVKSITMARIVK